MRVYRRHTNFSLECIEHTLGGNPDFGRRSTVDVLRNGDLCTKVLLKIKLNAVKLALSSGSQRLSVGWVRRFNC